MKICFVTTGNIKTLATMKRATGMAEALITNNIEVSILALDCEDNRERFNYECPNAKIYYFRNGSVLAEIKQKKKLIKTIQPDLIYVCSFGFRNFIHKFSNGKLHAKYVVEHSELFSSIENINIFKRSIYKVFESSSKFLFNGQIAASKYLEEYFSKQLSIKDRGNLLYLPYAYNNNILNFDLNSCNKIKSELKSSTIMLYMGTLRINYGFLDIIKAGEILKKKYEDLKILIMGSGVHAELGKKLIREHNLEGVIKMLGYVSEDQLGNYFKIADVFISPINDTVQDWARCPSKLFMYLPFNKPIVTCKIGEAKELFQTDDFFYSPGNINELVEKLEKAINEKDYISEVDPLHHNWEYRTSQFLNWINNNIIIN